MFIKIFLDVMPCKTLLKLLNNMLNNRFFTVYIEEKKSRTTMLKNGFLQGSMLAPFLFNIYVKGLPATTTRKFINADDLALSCQSKDFEGLENTVSENLDILHTFLINGDSNLIHPRRKSPSSI